MGTPSTTYNGWLLPEIDVMFLKITVLEAPGAPLVEDTFKPGTLPCKEVMNASLPDSLMVLPSTTWMDEPTARPIRFIPNSAVTTTSSMAASEGSSVMLMEFPAPTVAVAVLNPTKVNSSTWP